jgi:copper chaperone CopZ
MKFPKSIVALSFIALVFAACKPTSSEPNTDSKAPVTVPSDVVAKPETATFHIEGMTCAIGCAKTIEKQLCKMPGVQKAEVDFDKKLATVNFNAAQQSPKSITKLVEATGDGKTYKVSEMNSVPFSSK